MSVQHQKNLFKKLVGMAGIASASVLLSLPGLAQAAPSAGGMNQSVNNSDRPSDSTMTDGQLLAQTMSGQELNGRCAGYEGNATTGGGYYCALPRMNSGYGTTQPQGSSNVDNGRSTTGAGYPGNNVTPQGVDNRMNRESSSSGDNTQSGTASPESSNTDNGRSTTGAGYPGNNVTPQGVDKNLDRQSYNRDSNTQYEKATDNTYKRTGDSGFYNELTGEHFAPDENVISP
jgi:hypothetical protein